MADYIKTNEIQTRISLKYDSYEKWTSKNPVLLKGEVAIATVPTGATTTPAMQNLPNVVMKIGDGTSQYNALPFVSALAADVYEWAKASTKPSYDIGEISNAMEYRLATIDANNHKYALQARKAGSEETWNNVADSTIDLSALVADVADHETRIGTIEGDLNTAETGLKARMTAAETAIEGITSAGGAIGSAINKKIQTLDANLTKTVGGLTVSLTQVDGVVTAIEGSIAAETYDAYGAASTAKQELLDNEIKANTDAIDVIEGNDAGKSMREVATAVVGGLGATVNQAAGNDGLALEVVQENGVLKSVSGSIAANTYDAHGAAAAVQGDTAKTVKDIEDAAATAQAAAEAAQKAADDEAKARKAAIEALDYEGYEDGAAEGATISFVGTVSESNGVISATKRDLVFTDAYSANNPAATKKYVDDAVTSGVADLTGAMHFEGVKEKLPSLEGEHGYSDGDVIIVGVTEYVYSKGTWVQLGDEGALGAALQALKLDETGAVDSTLVISQTNGLVSAKAEKIQIAQTQVTGLPDALNTKLAAETFNTFKDEEFALIAQDVETLKGTGDGSVTKKISDSLATLNQTEVGAATKTLKVKQENGKVTAKAIDIAIEQTQVNGLPDALNAKLNASDFNKFKTDDFEPVKTAVENMDNSINAKIQALDANVSQEAGTDGLALNIVEVDGVITSISGSIAAETYDEFGAAAAVQGDTTETVASAYALAAGKATLDEAKGEITKAIEALDSEDTEVAGEFITTASQTNGVISVKRAKVNIKHLAQDENSYVVFNCGSSEINI